MSALVVMRCKSCMRYLGKTRTMAMGVNYCDDACAAFPPARDLETRNLYLLHMRAYYGMSWRMLASLVGITHPSVAPVMRNYDPVHRK